MNIGIRLHDTAEGTLAQRLSFARAQGFSCAHLALSKALKGFSMSDAPALLTEELAARVKGDFAEQQMDCAVLGCYLTLTQADEEERQKTRGIYQAHLTFSRMMNAGVVGTETAAPKGMNPHSEEAFQLFIRCLKPLVRWAEEQNAILAIEPVCTDIVSTPEKAERMLKLVPSDHLRIILDSVNLMSAEAAKNPDALIEEAIRRLGDKVSVLHMNACRPRSAAG